MCINYKNFYSFLLITLGIIKISNTKRINYKINKNKLKINIIKVINNNKALSSITPT